MTDYGHCPVCGGPCASLGAVDFNKSCEEARGLHLPPAGRLIHYVICGECGFAFAPEFAAWSAGDFAREIYNAGYGTVDPDHADARPRANAEMLLATFGAQRHPARHLDYGGGAGLLSTLLRAAGWRSVSHDPFFDRDAAPPAGPFQLITCFEVFEHVADVNGLAGSLSALLDADGLVLISTLLSDDELRRGQPIGWWYASPRNGHISLHSARSLALLASRHGFSTASFSAGLHAWWRQEFPAWARHLVQGA